jgi:hypothetical protein
MVSGIDHARCVVVFITQRYVSKVDGDNVNDSCQMEFSYAARTKSSAKMVTVVMEERMRKTNEWPGSVGIMLGGNLYVDMCGDLNNPEYLAAKADELLRAILRVIGTPLANFSWDKTAKPGADEGGKQGKAVCSNLHFIASA